MYIFLNGEIVQKEKASISPFDHGYMYGLGLFETFRVYKGHPFLFDDHLERLREGIEQLNIDWEIDRNQMLSQLNDLLNANHLTDAYVRLNVSAGNGELGLQVESYTDPTILMYMKPLPFDMSFEDKTGVILETKRNSPEGTLRLKSHHYLNNILGKREIGNDPAIEGLFLNEKGHITEGIVSNVFWVKNQTVYTPSVKTGLLNGITRQFILELLKEENIRVNIGEFTVEDLMNCDECFVTNSIQEIIPLKAINKKTLLTDNRHIYYQLSKLYSDFKQKLWSRMELNKE